MASVQEMDTRLEQVGRMVEFVMKAISVAQPSPLVGMPPRVTSLFNLYHESQKAGLVIDVDPVKPDQSLEEPAPQAETVNA